VTAADTGTAAIAADTVTAARVPVRPARPGLARRAPVAGAPAVPAGLVAPVAMVARVRVARVRVARVRAR
jgi:hypothetical protein